MNLLLDTHILLWAAAEPQRIRGESRQLLEDPENTLHFSSASLWEVVIKNGLGRPDFQVEPSLLRRGLIDNGYLELPITSAHALAVANLPDLHKDPFDRILLAQADAEGMLLVTSDNQMAAYPVALHQVSG
jgi:PIN domain nuclease of toxin-antitoxin system